MKLLQEIHDRRAYRAFSGEKIDREQTLRILEAAQLAPSCMNKQPWQFVLFQTDEEMAQVGKALSKGNLWAAKASFITAVVTRVEDDCRLPDGREYALFDCGQAVENLQLQAVGEGLYAHPMAGFDQGVVKEIAGIPDEYQVVVLVAVGLPGDPETLDERLRDREHAPRVRKPLEEILHEGRW